jgi:hypothetical protein
MVNEEVGFQFSKPTLAGTLGNASDAPIPAIRIDRHSNRRTNVLPSLG